MSYPDFHDPRVQAELLALVPSLHLTDAIAFLGGSLVQGFGNTASDIDIIVLVPGAPVSGETAGYVAQRSIIYVDRYGDRRVDIEVLPLAEVESVAHLLRTQEEDLQAALDFPTDSLPTLDSMRIGIPLHGHEAFAALRDGFPWRELAAFLSGEADRMYQSFYEDAVGAIDAEDYGTALLTSREALGFALDAYIAALGHTNPRPKWRVRKLQVLGEDELLRRYLDAECDPSGEPEALLRRSVGRLRLSQEVQLLTHRLALTADESG